MIIEMMKKIKVRVSPEMEKKGFAPPDGPEAAIVEITLKDGKRYCVKNFFSDWRPDNMPSWNTVCKKYTDCASLVLSQEKLERTIEQIQEMERLETIRDLMATIFY
jgi:2-methylcitrate dehydratase PrpD